jgi:hypothetical protein
LSPLAASIDREEELEARESPDAALLSGCMVTSNIYSSRGQMSNEQRAAGIEMNGAMNAESSLSSGHRQLPAAH